MSAATANGIAILHGSAVLPLVGVWTADLTIDSADALPTGPRAITIDLGGQTIVGTVLPERRDAGQVRMGEYGNNVTARIVGGAGGLSKVLPAKKYRNAPMSIVLSDLMAETGEILSSTTDASVSTLNLPHFARAKGTATNTLAEVIRATGANWRVLPDGSIWFGTDTYPEAEFTGDILFERLGGSMRRLSPDAGTVLPGTTLRGRKLAQVVYHFSSSVSRAEAWAA